jgi:ATP-dependent exoDNAse (exonuclease V) beta subunit
MTALAPDDAARRRVATDLESTLFVDAGAGTGKTTALVERVLALVEHGVPLRDIATITFTEAAAAELRHRVRDGLEARRREATDAELATRYTAALDDADLAAISTLHAFAARVLRDHPFEVGLPPRFEVADEVASQLAFGRRWRAFVDAAYVDPELARPLEWAHLLGVRISSPLGASLERIARLLDQSWDRLVDLELPARTLPRLPRAELAAAVAAVLAIDVSTECIAPTEDGLAQWMAGCERAWSLVADAVAHGTDEQLLARLRLVPRRKVGKVGRKGNWRDIDAARDALTALVAAVGALESFATDAVLRLLTGELACATLAAADDRRRTGVLEFHDLLVLARSLLRDHPGARAALHHRYARVLVDEFQDTDPLQVELAVLIAAGPGAGARPQRWVEVDTSEGRLFFVGDPKQSIYRFRRADIRIYLAARARFAGAEPLALNRNFRSEPTVLAWINHLFGALMGEGVEGAQPEYQPLDAARPADPDHDHRVLLLGGPHEKDERVSAAELRELEARDIAAAIDAIRADPGAWAVHDRHAEQMRPARLDDVTILVPTRLSLRYLRAALEARAIPHRVETGSLVFDTPEVRDLVTVLRAIADPADVVALVAALRSPAFACGDDDLFAYHDAGGRWDLRAPGPAALPADHPVVTALAVLRELHDARHWLEPAELLLEVVARRRVLELGFGQSRPRDVWRRVRYLVDQARAFTESQGGDLLEFLDWVDLASADGARVHEPVLAEPDDVSVRIMTVHGAKGLEFPITIVAGTSTKHQPGGARFALHWDEAGRPEVALSKGVSTDSFDRLAELESEMDDHEKRRLLYVATTRARDYLLVGAHHVVGTPSFAALMWEHSQDAPTSTWRVWDAASAPPVAGEETGGSVGVAGVLPPAAEVLAARAAWSEARAQVLARAARPRVTSATALVSGDLPPGTAPVVEPDGDTGPGGDARPWRQGRAATAFGRAVHGVLQLVDLAGGEGAEALAAAQCTLEGIPDAVADVVQAARSALAAPIVRQAAAGRHWREPYVAVPVGDLVLEGYVDLVVETDAGLVVVDYKTDAVDGLAGAQARAEHYRHQGAAYAVALERVTGRPVVDCVFVFARPEGPIEQRPADLREAMDEVVRRLEASPAG